MSLAAYASETNKGVFAWPKLKRTFSCRNKLVYSILFLFKFRTCCTRCWRPLGFKRVNHKVYTTWEYRAIMKVTGKNAVSRNQTMLQALPIHSSDQVKTHQSSSLSKFLARNIGKVMTIPKTQEQAMVI